MTSCWNILLAEFVFSLTDAKNLKNKLKCAVLINYTFRGLNRRDFTDERYEQTKGVHIK